MQTEIYTPQHLVTGSFPVHTEPQLIAKEQQLDGLSVMGRVTATGELKLSVAAATDGSQVPVVILVGAVTTGTTAAPAPVYVAGCFNPELLVYGTGHTAATVRAALHGTPLFLRAPL